MCTCLVSWKASRPSWPSPERRRAPRPRRRRSARRTASPPRRSAPRWRGSRRPAAGRRRPPARLRSAAGSPRGERIAWVAVPNTYEQLADLPLEIDSYELEGLELDVSSDFTRMSTLIKLRGGGQEGVGEDVTYDGLDHVALQDEGPSLDLRGS